MQQNITYPQYRKYPHNKTFFKIISAVEWEEIHVMGSTYTLHPFKVAIFTDRNYIHDLTFDYEKNWVKITEEEYEGVKRNIK